jgi:predicted amidohydrolase YtcJ
MWCSVTRKDFYGEVIEPESAISLREAYRMHTIDAAAALGRDHEIGSLDVGKRADIAVLSVDPFGVKPDDLPSIVVESVLLGGVVTYQRQGAR